MIIQFILWCALAILKVEASEWDNFAEQIFKMDGNPVLNTLLCTHVNRQNISEAIEDAELTVYGNYEVNEKSVFKEICYLAMLNHPVWQIYLSCVFNEGRDWLRQDTDKARLMYQKACENPCLINGTYRLDPFIEQNFRYLHEIFKGEDLPFQLPDLLQALVLK